MLQGSMRCFCWLEMLSQVFRDDLQRHFVISTFVSSHSSFCATENCLELVFFSPMYLKRSWTHSPTWNFWHFQATCSIVSPFSMWKSFLLCPALLSLSLQHTIQLLLYKFITAMSFTSHGLPAATENFNFGRPKVVKKGTNDAFVPQQEDLVSDPTLIGLLYCDFAL